MHTTLTDDATQHPAVPLDSSTDVVSDTPPLLCRGVGLTSATGRLPSVHPRVAGSNTTAQPQTLANTAARMNQPPPQLAAACHAMNYHDPLPKPLGSLCHTHTRATTILTAVVELHVC
jgi:hypothetical protein